jgi:hypothetical protein
LLRHGPRRDGRLGDQAATAEKGRYFQEIPPVETAIAREIFPRRIGVVLHGGLPSFQISGHYYP